MKTLLMWWEQVKMKVYGIIFPSPKIELPPSKSKKQWVMAEKLDAHQNRNVMMVEVEYFPQNATKADLSNFTIEGEDPNLRITHNFPSDLVH